MNNDRRKALEKMHRFVRRTRSPRVGMSIIVLLTFAAIFLASHFMLSFGLTHMGLRYVVAVAMGYLVFIILLFLWTTNGWDSVEGVDGPEAGYSRASDATNAVPAKNAVDAADAADAADAFSVFDFEGLGILFIIGLLIMGLLFIFSLLYGSASLLLAELMLDLGLAGSLYKNMKNVPRESWLSTALRRTWRQFALLAFVMGGLGLILEKHVPDALTLGQALKSVL